MIEVPSEFLNALFMAAHRVLEHQPVKAAVLVTERVGVRIHR